MKISAERIVIRAVAGACGAVVGFLAPIFVVLSQERGHEVEASLARYDGLVGGDFLIVMSCLSACLLACFAAWLPSLWMSVRRPDSRAETGHGAEGSVWPPAPRS